MNGQSNIRGSARWVLHGQLWEAFMVWLGEDEHSLSALLSKGVSEYDCKAYFHMAQTHSCTPISGIVTDKKDCPEESKV